MLKKMVAIAAVLLVAGSVFGAYDANKFGTFDPNNISADRTVDWEGDGNNVQRKGESWNWPATYDFVPITEVKVQMDVGFWIRLLDCSTNRIIKLKQRQIRQYGGSLTCNAQTNVNTEWKADFKKKDGIDFGSYSWKAAVDPAKLENTKGASKPITIKVMLNDVDLKNLPAGTNCLDVGTVVVSVRPDVRPNLFMSGCGGSYPVYSPPPIDSTIGWW